MHQLRNARLIPGSETPAGDGVTGAMRCVIEDDQGRKQAAVLKTGSLAEIAAEATASLLLSGWGLPVSGINTAALVAGTPRLDDPTLGARQRDQLRENQLEIESEADAVNLRWYSAHSAAEGAMRVIELAG